MVVRPVTEDDRKSQKYFAHMGGMTGTVENVYADDLLAVRVDEASLTAANTRVHNDSCERIRQKFLLQTPEEVKKLMTKDELNFRAHFMQLIRSSDLEKIS